MVKTIRQTAIELLAKHNFIPTNYAGKYTHPAFIVNDRQWYVFIGKGHSIRIGPNKVTSMPITLGRLEAKLVYVNTLAIPAPVVRPVNVVTELRRDLHGMIGGLAEEQLRATIRWIQTRNEMDNWPPIDSDTLPPL